MHSFLKHILSLLVLLTASWATAYGALATGSWRTYPVYGAVNSITETPSTIFVVSDGYVTTFDNKLGETRTFTPGQDISGYDAREVYYNPDGNYAIITYADGNMDKLSPNGAVTNIPDIRDAVLNTAKEVNTVAFHDGTIFVGTSFGIVSIDEKSLLVKESYIYNRSVGAIAFAGETMFLIFSDGENDIARFEYTGKLPRLSELNIFGQMPFQPRKMMALNPAKGADEGHVLGALLSNNRLMLIKVPATGTDGSTWDYSRYLYKIRSFFPLDEGGAITVTGESVVRINPDGTDVTLGTIPSELSDALLSSNGSSSTLSAANASEGICTLSLGEGSQYAYEMRGIKPYGCTSLACIAKIVPSANLDGFVIHNLGISAISSASPNNENTTLTFRADRFDFGTEKMEEVTKGLDIKQPSFCIDDPFDPSRFYVGNPYKGMYCISNGEIIWQISTDNSPISLLAGYALRVYLGKFDKDNNLWVAFEGDDSDQDTGSYMILPADKVKAGIENASKEDWIVPGIGQQSRFRDRTLLFSSRYDIALSGSANRADALVAFVPSSALAGNAVQKAHEQFTDQDGKTFAPYYPCSFLEDRNSSAVWVGTNQGVFIIPDITKVLNDNLTITRVKVPRNDGTNLADYLLDTDCILQMAADAANRKWIVTRASGLYLVSADGSEILAHYTSDNSPLPTDGVCSVFCSPYSNVVYIGTTRGLFELASDASPAASSYDNVYAYPNPVTPDFSGFVTITGLMDNSLVKITDSALNTVAQLHSEGGMALWDCRNMNGAHVKAGVYYVLASTADGESSQGKPACKILVIR